MQQTFLFIDESWLAPLLILWALVGSITLAVLARKKGINQELWNGVLVWGVGAVIIYAVVPAVMVDDPRDGEGRALAVRGYGFFLLIGVIAGVFLAIHRARQLGLHPDVTLNLCFVLFVTGIIGARLYYVIEYWPQFQVDGRPSFAKIINMTEGGLVVFGSIIGGTIGGIVFLSLKKIPVLLMLDILGPCMMIGLSVGRIGCLMNGCCWGGVCDSPMAIQFPEGAPPYARHVETGELFGMKAEPTKASEPPAPREILVVETGSAAERAGIKVGDQIVGFEYDPNPSDGKLPGQIVYLIKTATETRTVEFPQELIPEYSRPVHPTQIYSSINAFLVFLFLWFYFPSRSRDGQVFALLMIIYPVGRFLLEMIRSDELGQLGTELTPAQMTGPGVILGGIVLITYGWFYLKRTEAFGPPKSQN